MPLLGCIADDFTGATDLASTLVAGGMRTQQVIGVPNGTIAPDADAVVVALKSRSNPVDDAVAQSLAALEALRAAGCQRFFFKYCSTFDSTDKGNIGPVAEALMDALGTRFTIACPAFPENGRTVFFGHLFVGDRLLSESGMRHHPVTPMHDPDLVRVLSRQTSRGVGLIDYRSVRAGADAVRSRAAALEAAGTAFAIADATDDADLRTLGTALSDRPLLTGGSGLALGLPAAYRDAGLLANRDDAAALAFPGGIGVVLSGSCSQATNGQVARWLGAGRPAYRLEPQALASGAPVVEEALACFDGASQPVLIYATDTPEGVANAQAQLGQEQSGALVEKALATIAQRLLDKGVRNFVVAGGETSGAVVSALGVSSLRIGAPIDPGVPWTTAPAADGSTVALALKSGNFGAPDFFDKALRIAGVA
ncbi:3-oxo-tetronate kinase [Mangrovicella endophytica]|uniref:3-oxo-tetronate kinase n=1 Tax=Mangrovicella endophytica TaxID=2066697 RepID=UPI000C9EBC1B|nr:3-oxo-tetronate kinase [Mangrovicella endophytica]